MQGVTRELLRRAGEAASLFSCALNVVIGTGDREITLSAGSWELCRRGAARGTWLVKAIDVLPFNGDGHCEAAWNDHVAVWLKVWAD